MTITASQSLVGYSNESLQEWIDIQPTDEGASKYLKLGSSSVIYFLSALIMLIEGVFRAAIALAGKVLTVLIPKDYASESIDWGIKFMAKSAVKNVWKALENGYKAVGKSLSLEEIFQNEAVKNGVRNFSRIHIDGFSERAKDQPDEFALEGNEGMASIEVYG